MPSLIVKVKIWMNIPMLGPACMSLPMNIPHSKTWPNKIWSYHLNHPLKDMLNSRCEHLGYWILVGRINQLNWQVMQIQSKTVGGESPLVMLYVNILLRLPLLNFWPQTNIDQQIKPGSLHITLQSIKPCKSAKLCPAITILKSHFAFVFFLFLSRNPSDLKSHSLCPTIMWQSLTDDNNQR